MVQRVTTVAFEGIEVRPVDARVQVAPGLPAFTVVDCQCQMDGFPPAGIPAAALRRPPASKKR